MVFISLNASVSPDKRTVSHYLTSLLHISHIVTGSCQDSFSCDIRKKMIND